MRQVQQLTRVPTAGGKRNLLQGHCQVTDSSSPWKWMRQNQALVCCITLCRT